MWFIAALQRTHHPKKYRQKKSVALFTHAAWREGSEEVAFEYVFHIPVKKYFVTLRKRYSLVCSYFVDSRFIVCPVDLRGVSFLKTSATKLYFIGRNIRIMILRLLLLPERSFAK